MAIRNDFTAGEVLAAADLNDTFASKVPYAYGTATPSTTVDGFVWYDENETPPAPKFWDGAAFQAISAPSGLVHIATELFSAVSSVSVNNVFTSAYANYRFILDITNASQASGVALNMRMRASGADETGSVYYLASTGRATTGSDFNTNQSGETSFVLLWISGSGLGSGLDIQNPKAATRTALMGTGIGLAGSGSTDYSSFAGGGAVITSTAYDGYSLFPASGTITGTIRIYGYQNS